MDRGEIEAVLGFGIHGSGEEQEEQKPVTVTYAEKAPRGSHLQVQELPYRTEKVLWQVGQTKESRGSGLWKQHIIG